MKRRGIDLIRILAVFFVLLWITYFYFNIFSPASLPKSLRIGTIRKPLNILIIGTDITFDAVTHKPMPQLRGRADTILLTRIDPIEWKINIFSIPRDTCVMIPDYETQRINVANAVGGPALLKKTVSLLTGEKIDHYLEVKPYFVTKLVDLLGGVYLEVEEDMRYIDRAQGLNIDLKKGYQKLSGKEAHDYIRYRDKIKGDIGRISRQQKFFKALSRTMTRPANIFKAPFAIHSALEEIETDLPLQLTIRILNFARMFSPEKIQSVMLPGEVSFVEGIGSVWVPDERAIKKTVKELF